MIQRRIYVSFTIILHKHNFKNQFQKNAMHFKKLKNVVYSNFDKTNNMKRNLIVVMILMCVIVLDSCRKYEEGPIVSLRSARQRLTNNWGLESALINGVELASTPYYAKQKHYLYGDNRYILTVVDPLTGVAMNIQGNWNLYDKNKKLALTTKNYTGNIDSTTDYVILKSFEKQLWIRSVDNVKEFHFKPFDSE